MTSFSSLSFDETCERPACVNKDAVNYCTTCEELLCATHLKVKCDTRVLGAMWYFVLR